MIAILGTGLLGSGFARALLRRGETVHVWNRTPAAALELEPDGAHTFADPADAVADAQRVHVALADDAAVDHVLALAERGLTEGAWVIDHTTTSTAGARERTESWLERGVTYLHAPVFMGPKNALESAGLMLVSGDREVVRKARPMLEPMTGKLIDLGPRVDAAAAFKLLGNLFLMTLAAGFTDMLALAKAVDLAPSDVATLFEYFNPGANAPARFARILEADYDHPSWTLAMARKDARLIEAECDDAGVPLATLPAFAALMDDLLARGFRDADWTIVAKHVLER